MDGSGRSSLACERRAAFFEGGVIAGPTDQQDFLAIIALTPAEEREGAKLMRYLPDQLLCRVITTFRRARSASDTRVRRH